MSQCVVCDFMSAPANLFDQLRKFFRAITDDEEGRARFIAIEQVENLSCVFWRRAIVDRNPDFFFGCGERANHWSPPLRMGIQRRVEKKRVRHEQRHEREQQILLNEKNCPDRCRDGENQNELAQPGISSATLHRKARAAEPQLNCMRPRQSKSVRPIATTIRWQQAAPQARS